MNLKKTNKKNKIKMHFSTHIKIIILLEFYILNEKVYNGPRIEFLGSMES